MSMKDRLKKSAKRLEILAGSVDVELSSVIEEGKESHFLLMLIKLKKRRGSVIIADSVLVR